MRASPFLHAAWHGSNTKFCGKRNPQDPHSRREARAVVRPGEFTWHDSTGAEAVLLGPRERAHRWMHFWYTAPCVAGRFGSTTMPAVTFVYNVEEQDWHTAHPVHIMADGGGGGGSAGINDANIVEGNEANGTPRSCCSKRLLLLPVDFSSSVQAGVMLDASNASDLSCDIGLCRASWHFTNSKGSITGRAPNKVGNDALARRVCCVC
mmetsp:Transcript_83210/g.165186  ORF Transcript_83210/g.165186 Transcript_83210/m.165186 type:complete len:208 (-) Transcript_83210:78-701(-)